MAYTLSINLVLAESDTGLSLEAQLIDTAGVNVGGAIATGFVELTLGNYLWTYASFPDGFRGGVKFSVAGGGALKAFTAVNPQEVEQVRLLSVETFDGRALSDILIDLLSMASGRIVEGPAGTFSFYERDNTTVRYTLVRSGSERTRS